MNKKMFQHVRVVMLMAIVALFSITHSGCQHLKQLLDSTVKKPELQYKRLRLQNVSFTGMTMEFEFEMRNPNPVGVKFATLDYQLDFDGHQLFQGKQPKGIELAANGTSPLRVPFTIEYMKFIKSLLSFFQQKNNVPYRLQIGFGFDTSIGIINIPLDLKGEVPLPKLPKIRIAGAKMGQISFSGASFSFSVALKNEGSFPIKMQGLEYGFKIGDISVATGQSKIVDLDASKEQILEIPVQVQFLKVGMAIAQIIQSRQVPYNFDGRINLGLFQLPFSLQGKLQL
jgi:LEA14-like dessication related protein